MSETSDPGRREPAGNQEKQSEAPAQQPAQAPPAQEAQAQQQPPPPPPPASPAPRRPARTVKLWLAALIAGVLLLGSGLGGFFIGYASGDDHRDRPGAVWHDRGPHNFPDWPERPPRDR